MAEYIDRQAAIALAKDIIVPTKSGYDYRHRCIDPQDLAELPTADVVERKTGKWEDKGHDNVYQCSVCSDLWMGIGGYRFCPNCGAKMIGGDDNV